MNQSITGRGMLDNPAASLTEILVFTRSQVFEAGVPRSLRKS
jgi:hypothetical protein